MYLSNGQRWFIVIMLSFSISFFIISTALTMFPPNDSYMTSEDKKMSSYESCVKQASVSLYGESEKQALSQCIQLIEHFNNYK